MCRTSIVSSTWRIFQQKLWNRVSVHEELGRRIHRKHPADFQQPLLPCQLLRRLRVLESKLLKDWHDVRPQRRLVRSSLTVYSL